MGNTLIKVGCYDQRLILLTAPTVASGGRDEDRIEFEFCALWEGFGKTAVFYRTLEEVYHVPLVEDACIVPHEVLTREGEFYFGVFGVKGDKIRTSEVIPYKVVRGAPTTASEPLEPTPNIYEQILSSLADLENRVEAIEKSGGGSGGGSGEVTPEAIAGAVEAYLEENPVVGEKGDPGEDGKDGKDGVSVTHNWSGTVLTVTSASGTSSADLRGAKGDTGAQGEPGAKGDKGDKGDTGAKGDPGVYVGSEAPTDESVNVWIDPDGEPSACEEWEFTLSDGSIVKKRVVLV